MASDYTAKAEISYEDYLKLEGLLVLGRDANRECNRIGRAVADIIGEDDPVSGERPGHAMDAVITEYSARELLRKNSIIVLPPVEAPR